MSSSGVIIDKLQGTVLTNSHCISSENVRVIAGDIEFNAHVVGRPTEMNGESLDICILKIQNQKRNIYGL